MDEEKVTSKDIVDLIPLDTRTKELAQQIINEESIEKTQDLVKLFNLNQAKKNVLRVLKLNSLLDKVSDEMITRFEKRPGEFANNDLLNYMNVVQSSIDRANKQLNLVDETPNISLTQVNVNVEENKLDRESRAKITEAVSKILEMSKKLNINLNEQEVSTEIIDEPVEEPKEDFTVYNNENKLLNEEEE
ncbi:hypothetical protein [uncultured Clostridium sp.]|uniref:hypothetical protein n=1 Tax=uncultured Clostridium sp. TaxID=59620 RepID=UPI00260A5475|nr:hypothetical protein [uncultured Clostridium sp.]